MSETATEPTLYGMPPTPFGPTGEVVYNRTYSRKKPDGSQETWPETVHRVVRGNLELVYGPEGGDGWTKDVWAEADRLQALMLDFKIIPAGRHLWASGVKGRQYLFNCHVSGWGEKLSDHFEFTFMRLMEGGGVGANYSSRFLAPYGSPRRHLNVHIVCDPAHADYQAMKDAGILSSEYDSDWDGAYEVEDSREGWSDALVDLIDTFMTDDEVRHSERVYDVSRVRPRGARLKTFGGTASGPQPFAVMLHKVAETMNRNHEDLFVQVAYEGRRQLTPLDAMDIDHAIAECVVSGGTRRSARMAICHWKDPFIDEFLTCKADPSKNWTTNVSVEIDDEFVETVNESETIGTLQGTVVKTVRSAAWGILQRVVEGMLTNGEPGLWNSSLSNIGETGEVVATNPCGEIALEAWENCNLGHINLDAFAPKTKHGPLDWAGLTEAHRLMTRFLIRATYGDVNDPKQADRLAANRRIGVGHLGVQGFLAKRGIRYSQATRTSSFPEELKLLASTVRNEARRFAFELRIPEPVKVTTVAPTGTIAKMPGVTEGIHPIYSRHFIRRIRFNIGNPDELAQMERYESEGYHSEQDVYDASGNTWLVEFPTKEMLVQQVEDMGYPAETVESADEISLADMLAFQALYQGRWADNAVSFTANVPAEFHQQECMDVSAPIPYPTARRVEEVMATIINYLPYLKGTTLMLDGSRPQAPYERITEEAYEAAQVRLVADGVDDECATGACPVR